MNDRPLVSACIFTYNHEGFIKQCIEGALKQEVNFSYEIVIGENNSTDDTASICEAYAKKYPKLIRLFKNKENLGMSKNWLLTMNRCKGKYIALCDGDDFWTDAEKLQKQVDFLEQHDDFILVTGGYYENNIINGNTNKIPIVRSSIVSSDLEDKKGFKFDLMDTRDVWITKTAACCFRNIPQVYSDFFNHYMATDVQLFYYLLKNGKGYYFKKPLFAYTIRENSPYNCRSKEVKLIDAYKIYKDLYEKNKDEFTRFKYFKSIIFLLNYKFSFLLKHHKIDIVNLFNTALELAKTKNEKWLLMKSFVPRQIKEVFNNKSK